MATVVVAVAVRVATFLRKKNRDVRRRAAVGGEQDEVWGRVCPQKIFAFFYCENMHIHASLGD
jgi:hypothetical protein